MDLRPEDPDPAGPNPPDSELKGAALLSALRLGAPRCDEVSDVHEFAGAIAGTDIFVGVLFGTLGGELVGAAYACDGDSISEWFGISGGGTDDVEYISPEGGTITGTVSDAEIIGRVRLSSRSTYDLSLPAVEPGGEAGLYVANWHTGMTMNHPDRERWVLARIVLGGQ